MKYGLLWCSVSVLPLMATAAFAADTTDISGDVFGLGRIEQVTVTGTRGDTAIGETTVDKDQLYQYGATTLDKALELVPGVSTSTTGGTRNEKLFFIRGFDRFQSPLYVDGIRIYLPADNRLDISFFNTGDLAEIQVEKGYVSILSGPGAIGGAINMVTRKPSEALEYEASAGSAFGTEGYDGFTGTTRIGTKQKNFYLQAGASITKYDHTDLSEDFVPTANEDGGKRNHTATRNYSLNLKAGWTPNATDEYSISYTGQWGRKEAPYSTVDAVSSQKNWTWPNWDVQNIYFLSNTALNESAHIKTRAFYSVFRNGLYAFDDATFSTQTLGKSFRSYYSDYAYGGNIEGDYDFGTRDSLKLSYFYRRDSHTEWQTTYKPALTEPKQVSVEDTHSIAAENRLRLSDNLDFLLGASYDYRHLLEAHDYSSGFLTYPRADDDAINLQGQLIYDFGTIGNVHASISDRTRFPTLFDRYSTKFNTTLSNPDLNAERAINYEIGGHWNLFEGTKIDAAVFYSKVNRALESVSINFCDTTSTKKSNCTGSGGAAGVLTSTTQTQNVGNGDYVGFEVSADTIITDGLTAGVRYSYTDRSMDAQSEDNPALTTGYHLTGMPNSQLFAFVTWQLLPSLSLTPNIQTASNRWSTNTAGTSYFKMGSYTLFNLQADYALTDKLDLSVSAKNLFDVNYALTYGFPEQGRNIYAALRFKS